MKLRWVRHGMVEAHLFSNRFFLCLSVRKCCKDMLGVKVLVSFELFFHLFHIEVFSVGFHTENTRRITNLTF